MKKTVLVAIVGMFLMGVPVAWAQDDVVEAILEACEPNIRVAVR